VRRCIFRPKDTTRMPDTNKQYNDIIAACEKLFVDKTKDYGTSWRILRTASLTDQIFIKANRIRTLQEVGQAQVAENFDDAFMAIVNYSAMALIQLELSSDAPLELSIEEAHQRYCAKVDETRDLMLRKNHDYGEAWRDMRVSSLTDLILMKLLRIKQIENNSGATLVSEGVASNYQDILNYAVFALIHLNETAA